MLNLAPRTWSAATAETLRAGGHPALLARLYAARGIGEGDAGRSVEVAVGGQKVRPDREAGRDPTALARNPQADPGRHQRHDGDKGLHQHTAVADKAGLARIRQHLRRGSG